MIVLRGVTRDFTVGGRRLRAVHDVTLTVDKAETVAVVGESGSGKSTLLRIAVGIDSPSSGSVEFRGRALSAFNADDWRRFRSAVQPVFQDPWGSLNPRMRVDRIVMEPLRCLLDLPRTDAATRAAAALESVGLDSGALRRYPHEFSGGQRQRIAIARALALRPEVVVLDEPVSALDVSIRAQIVNLLKDLQAKHGLGYLLVSHDMPTVWGMSDRVVVLYRGKVMEEAGAEVLRRQARSPYTLRLLDSVLPDHPSMRLEHRIPRESFVPTSAAQGERHGCPFHTACPVAIDRCHREIPELLKVGPGHAVACHLHADSASGAAVSARQGSPYPPT